MTEPQSTPTRRDEADIRTGQRIRRAYRDIARLAWYVVGGTLALVIPPSADRQITRCTAAITSRRYRKRVLRVERIMHHALDGRRPETDWTALAHENVITIAEDWWARTRNQTPRRWNPDIEVTGFEHLQAAMATGKGAVLWRASVTSSMVVKIALHRRGIGLVHLSHPNHGRTSNGWLGRRVLPWFFVRAEVPYLDERIVIPADGSLDHLRAIVDRLKGGAVVSIVGDHKSSRPFTWPLLGKAWAFATGAPSLSRMTGCTLLPVFAARVGPQRYRVEIQDPIVVDPSLKRRAFTAKVVGEFAHRLGEWLTEHPADWYMWQRYGR